MRQAINENRTVQLVLLGVLGLAVGVLLMTRMGGGEEAAPSASPVGTDATSSAVSDSVPSGDNAAGTGATPTTSPSAGSSAPGAAAPTGDPAAAGTPPAPAAIGAAASAAPVTPAALVPGPGLPAKVKTAWDRGSPIALLIVRGGAVDDRLVRRSVEALPRTGVTVFVARAKDVARYSRITQGVGVSRVPALVVVRPKSASGSVPQATVSYGFRSSQSVVQAVEDALYGGKDDLPYHPG